SNRGLARRPFAPELSNRQGPRPAAPAVKSRLSGHNVNCPGTCSRTATSVPRPGTLFALDLGRPHGLVNPTNIGNRGWDLRRKWFPRDFPSLPMLYYKGCDRWWGRPAWTGPVVKREGSSGVSGCWVGNPVVNHGTDAT